MNLFQVDFVQGKTDALDYNQVKHSLVDLATNRQIIDLTTSPDRLASVSNYGREPKRLNFECLVDQWITDYLLSGSYEHERYVSHYEVRVYRDSVLIFSGIIDTSQLVVDDDDVLKLTCYDKSRLLVIFNDLTHFFGVSAGYTPEQMIAYIAQDVSQTIPVAIPIIDRFDMPVLNFTGLSPLLISKVEYNEFATLPVNGGGWVYSTATGSWATPKFGYYVLGGSNECNFVFAHKILIDAYNSSAGTHQYQARYKGRVVRIFNGICTVVSEYEELSAWQDALADLADEYADFVEFFTDLGIAESVMLSGLVALTTYNYRNYVTSHASGLYVQSDFTGNVFPERIKPGDYYVTRNMVQTDNLKALQAMLMLYNATIYTVPSGAVVFATKGSYETTIIDIADTDVIISSTKRLNQEKPDTTCLDILAGDTESLQTVIKDYLIDYHDGKWSIEATIDQLDKYALTLQSKLRIKGQIYAVTELDKDFKNDEYRLIAWRMEA